MAQHLSNLRPADPAVPLTTEQQFAQLQEQLAQQGLRSGLAAAGVSESGSADQLSELARLRQELQLGRLAPGGLDLPPAGPTGGGLPPAATPTPTERPTPRPPPATPLGSLPSAPSPTPEPTDIEPDFPFEALRRAVQAGNLAERAQVGRGPGAGDPRAVEDRARAGFGMGDRLGFGAPSIAEMFTRNTAQATAVHRQLQDPEAAMHDEFLKQRRQASEKTGLELGESIVRAWGKAERLEAQRQALAEDPVRDQLVQQFQNVQRQLTQGGDIIAAEPGRDPEVRPFSDAKRRALEGLLTESMAKLRAHQARVQEEAQQIHVTEQQLRQRARREYEQFAGERREVAQFRGGAARRMAQRRLGSKARRIAEAVGLDPGRVYPSGLTGREIVEGALSSQDMDTLVSELGRGRDIPTLLGVEGGAAGLQGLFPEGVTPDLQQSPFLARASELQGLTVGG